MSAELFEAERIVSDTRSRACCSAGISEESLGSATSARSAFACRSRERMTEPTRGIDARYVLESANATPLIVGTGPMGKAQERPLSGKRPSGSSRRGSTAC